jgi:hypothetical protein
MALTPLLIGWGPDASSGVLRRSKRVWQINDPAALCVGSQTPHHLAVH